MTMLELEKRILDSEEQIREAELKVLDEYKAGKIPLVYADTPFRYPGPMLYKTAGYFKAQDSGDGMFTFVANQESLDRVGDVLIASGWQLDNYKKNPVILFSHSYAIPPVAKAPKVWVEGKNLMNAVQFDMEDDFARFLAGKVQRGFLNAESVGFRPIEFEKTDTGIKFTKQELLEISLVPVPAHPLALRKAIVDSKFSIVMPGIEEKIQEVDMEQKALSKANKEKLAQAISLVKDVMEGTPASSGQEESEKEAHGEAKGEAKQEASGTQQTNEAEEITGEEAQELIRSIKETYA